MDVTAVKMEIKTWEREFRTNNGRNATVDDIKAHANIAEKYKLYKKLTKEAEAAKGKANAHVPEPPRTPPPRAKQKHRDQVPSNNTPTAILPKSRPVASTSDIATNNPFSPVKRKQADSSAASTSANPFLTPLKAKRTRTPSPDLFPPITDVTASASTSLQNAAAPAKRNAAVLKARKRLRGEPVSPSPQPREKRRRLGALNPPANDNTLPRSVSPMPAPVEEGESFVDDSPVKAPVGGKAFKPLFEEAKAISLSQPAPLKSASAATRPRAFSRAKTVPGGLFGGAKKEVKEVQGGKIGPNVFGAEGAMEVDVATKPNGKDKGKEKARLDEGAQKEKKKRVLPGPKGLIPGKDDLFEVPPPATIGSSSSSAPGRDTKTSRKRTLSKVAEDEPKGERTVLDGWDLLPPSPLPKQDNGGRYNNKGKGKGKAAPRRNKKAKLSPAESDDDIEEDVSSSESGDVKMVAWRGRRRTPPPGNGDDMALALDPELQFHLRGRPADVRAQSASPRLERFEVDLPEEMRRVLALSPHDRDREREEDDLVKDVMRGKRKGGGMVWGPGEVGGEENDEGAVKGVGEDDWEGEGVPWELGEL